jgi:hypothetical protein
MRRLRSALLFVLCAALPLSGYAGWVDVPVPCAMGQGADADSMAAAMAPCCEHHRPAEAGGSSCEASQHCACAVTGLPQAFAVPTPLSPPGTPTAAVLVRMASIRPAAVWRPPTSL